MNIKVFYKVLFLVLISFPLQHINAQKERNQWYFGMLAGMKYNGNSIYSSLDDNNIPRRIVFGQIEGPDNIICANDEEGNLMFYSDGRTFKNRLHQNMLNSPTNEYAFWESQAAIARDPGNPNKFYVFVTIQDGLKRKLSYTVVDMSLDNGLGGLESNNTHVIMVNDVGQHMVTARHANGRDTWLICLRRGTYRAYLITENGISNTPVTSHEEGVSYFDGNSRNFGIMEVSPDNKLIAAGFPILRKLFVLKFNDLTGKLKLAYEEEAPDEPESLGAFTGVEFSANSKVLYTTYLTSGIQQYDLFNLNNIPPRIDITTINSTYPYLKRGPDGQIFSIQRGSEFIGAIQNPDIIGSECNYQANVLNLDGRNLLDLPTFLLPKHPKGISFINICEGETTEFKYTTSLLRVNYQWDLGDGNTATGENVSHTYSAPGTYTVSVKVYDNLTNALKHMDTKEITVYPTPSVFDLDDLYLCTEDTTIFFQDNNSAILNGMNPNVFKVFYYSSEIDALLKDNEVLEYVPEIGSKTIWVRVENTLNPSCYDIVSYNIVTPDFITIDIPTEQYLCNEKSITLSAPAGFVSYEWSTGETTQSITVNSIGNYSLSVVNDYGDFTCESETVITVNGSVIPPVIEDIEVIDWSLVHNSIKIIMSQEGNYEFSVDGFNYQSSPQFLNLPIKDYKVYVRDVNCFQQTTSDTLFLLYYNKFFTPNNDGVNDYWQIINSIREEDIQILILNRYGKLLTKLKYNDKGWDGTANGMQLPSSDYWFKVIRSNGNTHYGHFTLKR